MGEARKQLRGCCTSHGAPASPRPAPLHAQASIPPGPRASPTGHLPLFFWNLVRALQVDSTELADKTLGSKPALPLIHSFLPSLVHSAVTKYLLYPRSCSRCCSNSTGQRTLPSWNLSTQGRDTQRNEQVPGDECFGENMQGKTVRVCYTRQPRGPL